MWAGDFDRDYGEFYKKMSLNEQFRRKLIWSNSLSIRHARDGFLHLEEGKASRGMQGGHTLSSSTMFRSSAGDLVLNTLNISRLTNGLFST